jgi:TPR repeat protein
MLLFGEFGVEKNYNQALIWLMHGAEQGDSNSEYGIGCLYGYCDDDEHDFDTALTWFRESSEKGNGRLNVILYGPTKKDWVSQEITQKLWLGTKEQETMGREKLSVI